VSTLDQHQMELHVKILGWLHIVGNALLLLGGVAMFFFLVGLGVVIGDPQALPILSIVGTVGGLLMVALAIPGLIAGLGLLKRRNWARILALVLAIFALPNFPIGTAMGVYTGFVLLQNAAPEYFA
jgi:hypothetical protein